MGIGGGHRGGRVQECAASTNESSMTTFASILFVTDPKSLRDGHVQGVGMSVSSAKLVCSYGWLGTVTALDQSSLHCAVMGACGIGEGRIHVTLLLNEPSTVHCCATRMDAGEPRLVVNHMSGGRLRPTRPG